MIDNTVSDLYLFRSSSAHRVDLQTLFEQSIAAIDLAAVATIRVSRCLSRCERGPNVLVYPGRIAYRGLDAAAVETIVTEHRRDGVPVQAYRDLAC